MNKWKLNPDKMEVFGGGRVVRVVAWPWMGLVYSLGLGALLDLGLRLAVGVVARSEFDQL